VRVTRVLLFVNKKHDVVEIERISRACLRRVYFGGHHSLGVEEDIRGYKRNAEVIREEKRL